MMKKVIVKGKNFQKIKTLICSPRILGLQEWEEVKVENTRYTVEHMKNIVDYYDSRKTNKLGQTTKRYSSVTNYATVKRFRSYVEANGTNLHKFKRLQQHVMERFS